MLERATRDERMWLGRRLTRGRTGFASYHIEPYPLSTTHYPLTPLDQLTFLCRIFNYSLFVERFSNLDT